MSYDINLKHLEYFIKVARLGSMTWRRPLERRS